MFLVDSSQAGADWEGTIAAIKKILEKAGAEIVSIAKWDDRRLAYDIKGKSRGTYILSYFRVAGGKIRDIEKSVRLSEKIIRVLILSAEKLSQDDIDKETPAMKLEKEKEEHAEIKSSTQTRAQATEPESLSPPQEPGESEKTEDFEQTEETKQSPEEESGKLPELDVNAALGVSMVTDDLTEKQPVDEQIEGIKESDEKERLQP
jgi:small subunit ribosomal protein S6